MKAKINSDGNLSLLRVGKWKRQYCPYTDEHNPCGDLCPKFKEVKSKGISILFVCGIRHSIAADERQVSIMPKEKE